MLYIGGWDAMYSGRLMLQIERPVKLRVCIGSSSSSGPSRARSCSTRLACAASVALPCRVTPCAAHTLASCVLQCHGLRATRRVASYILHACVECFGVRVRCIAAPHSRTLWKAFLPGAWHDCSLLVQIMPPRINDNNTALKLALVGPCAIVHPVVNRTTIVMS